MVTSILQIPFTDFHSAPTILCVRSIFAESIDWKKTAQLHCNTRTFHVQTASVSRPIITYFTWPTAMAAIPFGALFLSRKMAISVIQKYFLILQKMIVFRAAEVMA